MRTRKAAGFTLIELMVVITILGLLAGITSVALMPQLAKAKVDTSKQRMRNIMTAVDLYYVQKGRLPDSIAELCGEDGLLDSKEEPTDAWGNHFEYAKVDKKHYQLTCLGSDGIEGGEKDEADFTKDDLGKNDEEKKDN
jgi:general secretion pathway protein G